MQRTKQGGRKTGTPNKVTAELREVVKAIIEAEAERLPELLLQLKPADRVAAFCKLLPFCIPAKAEAVAFIEQPLFYEPE
jgi:hypothetical protein